MEGWGQYGQHGTHGGPGWQKGKGQVAAPQLAPRYALQLRWHCSCCGARFNWGIRVSCKVCGESKPDSLGWETNTHVARKGHVEEPMQG